MFAPLYKHIPALSRMDLKSKDIEHETVNENHHWLVTSTTTFLVVLTTPLYTLLTRNVCPSLRADSLSLYR